MFVCRRRKHKHEASRVQSSIWLMTKLVTLVLHGNGIYLGSQGQTTQGIYMAFGRGFDAEENEILSDCGNRLSAVYFICMEWNLTVWV